MHRASGPLTTANPAIAATHLDPRALDRLAHAVARDGVDAHHHEVVALLVAADVAARAPVLHGVLRDRGAPDAARLRAFGRVPWARLLDTARAERSSNAA